MNVYLRWALRLIGPLLLVYILATSNLAKIAAVLGEIDVWPLVLTLALMPAFVAVKAWRWNMLMRELGIRPPSLGFSMVIYSVGLFYGGATPGQSGDFLKALYLRDRGPVAPVLFSILLDRLFDFAIMAPLALLTLVAFHGIVPDWAQGIAVALAVAIIFATPLLMARGPRNWAMNLFQPVLPAKLQVLLEKWRDQFDVLTLRPGLMVNVLLASVGSATSTMVRIWLLYLAMRLYNVDLLAIIGSTALIALLQALPISFSGVGVRDAVLVVVLGAYNYSQEQAFALSLLFLILNIQHILVGFLLSLRYPIDKTATARNAELVEQSRA